MASGFPGGIISKTPPTVNGPVDGEGGTASGIWTLSEVAEYKKSNGWPSKVFPRVLYAWGRNNNGQLGDNTTVSKSSPVQVLGDVSWKYVAASYDHVLGVSTTGNLWAWGQGTRGRLGLNTTISHSSPVQVGALTNWAEVSAGLCNSIAVKTDGTLWTWGENFYGGLGLNTSSFSVDVSSPTQVGSLTTWAKVSQGQFNSFAIKTDGTLWAWGQNDQGKLGINYGYIGGQGWRHRSSPTQVGALTTWCSISAGREHTIAVRTDCTLWAWGSNGGKQLAQSDPSGAYSRSSPIQVSGSWISGKAAPSAIAGSGGAHSIGINTGGILLSWGANNFGQLGINSTTGTSSISAIYLSSASVDVNARSTVAIKDDGTLWAWGSNCCGAVGDNTVIHRSSPVQVSADTNWVCISTHAETVIAMKKDTS